MLATRACCLVDRRHSCYRGSKIDHLCSVFFPLAQSCRWILMWCLCFRTTSATCASVQVSQERQSDVLWAEDHEKGECIWHGGREVKIKIQFRRCCKLQYFTCLAWLQAFNLSNFTGILRMFQNSWNSAWIDADRTAMASLSGQTLPLSRIFADNESSNNSMNI